MAIKYREMRMIPWLAIGIVEHVSNQLNRLYAQGRLAAGDIAGNQRISIFSLALTKGNACWDSGDG